jgi:TRAP-type C4-dicarboxylate transport system permease large subunit
VMNLCIGLCTPPVGSVLFVGCAVSGSDVRSVVRPLVPMYLAMVAALALVTFVPELSLWLPRALGR